MMSLVCWDWDDDLASDSDDYDYGAITDEA